MPIVRYEGKTIEKNSLVIEECHFIHCVLRDCDLFYSGGNFQWKETRFENCRFSFSDAAQRSQNLFQTLGLMKKQAKPPTDLKDTSTGTVN